MNSSAACHEMEGVPGLYVDAFRGSYLRKTTNPNNAFILTHYHGDHYGSLPRDDKYQGPAPIHCTPVTAELLRNVHKVPPKFVIEHNYGDTWKHRDALITFEDANHCPGAALVLIQLLLADRVHLHTGDFRYHPKMKTYPLLQQAVQNRTLDLLYLDTTYGHPKHDFVPQAQAVRSIATQIQQLHSNKPKRTLILLSCYSIGKEKVLWEAAERTHQLIYVTEKKWQMMNCLATDMVERCTRDANATDLHVIRMGTAGELWPYFRPNYRNCLDYEEQLDTHYDQIVAFIPTGWAHASNWNKNHAISQKQLQCRQDSTRRVDVEIRLIPYSEHSTFGELQEFTEWCRPRKVVPTVFCDANDRRRLETLFRNYVDTSRAKRQFFQGMQPTTKATSLGNKDKDKSKAHGSQSSSTLLCPEDIDKKLSAQPDAPLAEETNKASAPSTKSNDCTIDLTLLSSEDEDEKEAQDDEKGPSDGTRDPSKNTAATISSSLSPRKKSPPSSSKYRSPTSSTKATPTKRKIDTASTKKKNKKIATPPITQFFSMKAKR